MREKIIVIITIFLCGVVAGAELTFQTDVKKMNEVNWNLRHTLDRAFVMLKECGAIEWKEQ